MMKGWRYGWSNTWWTRREWTSISGALLQCWVNTEPVCIHGDKLWVEWGGEEWVEVGADNTEKQGHSAFPSLLPFRHLASTKGSYATAIYTHAPFPSRPPSHVRQHHMQTKWNCSSNQPPLSLFYHPKGDFAYSTGCFFFAAPVKRTCNARILEGNWTACHAVTHQMADEWKVTSRHVTTQFTSVRAHS